MELSLSSSENTMDQKWNSISSALYEAAAQTIGYKSKNHQDWFDENSETIHDLLKDMHRAHRATLKSPSSSSTRQQWQIICREVQRATRAMPNEWWTKKAHETQSFADKNDMHNFYNVVKKIYGPISRFITPLKTADGLTVLKDQHSILLRRAEHFGTLLNQDSDADPTVFDDRPTLPPMHNIDQPPTFLEVLSAIRSLKNNKSPGNDNIPAELLKQGDYLCTRALHKYITKVWADENVPQQWKYANVVAIYKNKGDKAVCGNNRGNSLSLVRSWQRLCSRG
ncbi:hypothetical protein KUCAC02_022300 [Chaenocephalus aceratus]|uniref:Uncharacterized protein n=1 Tax=Chaenocephalus aceratus TaxID=36190 RepID=A0ACB9XNM2_CHAAC|nr:hypothetical protein KUCAC02_022300 [Chaenocephalus aceratus]